MNQTSHCPTVLPSDCPTVPQSDRPTVSPSDRPTARLSLCVIAGNSEKYISRFLTCFGPLADEINIVQACGNLPPDRTLEIAAARGCKTAIYKNKPDNDWPHVDDFAAARNMAWQMASPDCGWIMWADLDDVIDSESIKVIRRTLNHVEHLTNFDEVDGCWVEYEVPEDGLSVMRERIMRAGRAHWIYPVHENLVFAGGRTKGNLISVQDAKIVHAPLGARGPNDERNLRILMAMPESERKVAHKFHMFQSMRALGWMEEAIPLAQSLVQDPEVGACEKYELLINLGQLAQDHDTRKQFFLSAVGVDPCRREAYGQLILWALASGNLPDAIGWAESMLSHPPPQHWPWNARRKFYGWLAPLLHGMALRGNARAREALDVELKSFLAAGARFSLLHATRGRPPKATQTKWTWLESADHPAAIEHIFAIDADDEASASLTANRHVIVPATGGGCVAAWNAAAAASAGEILIQVSDDFIPPKHWDTLIWERFYPSDRPTVRPSDGAAPRVLAVSDGHRADDLLCIAILNRARYAQQGHLFHPAFTGVYSDNWFTHCAQRDGVILDASDLVFEHQHPIFTGAATDATYDAQNHPDRYAEGRAIFNQLLAREKHA